MATLLVIRTALNAEIGVEASLDAETDPWTPAVRNQAISDAYADLWRVGIRKDAKQDLTTVADQWVYALTAIRQLSRLELLDSSSRILERPKGFVEADSSGAGTYQLALPMAVSAGYTLRVRGFAPYKSVFSGDSDTDDLPAEFARVPRLKAKIILYRQQVALFARYAERQTEAPSMTVNLEQLIGMVREAEAEYRDAAKAVAGLRQRASQPAHF